MWIEGLPNGEGTYKWVDGGTYQGEFLAGLKSGKGTLRLGEIFYKGDFINDKYHGEGRLVVKGEYEYVGEFSNGEFHGKGIIRYENGKTFNGEFNNGKKVGEGVLTIKHGEDGPEEKYVGEFQDDYYHGFGKYTFKDGSVYEGNWDRGKKSGKGTFFNMSPEPGEPEKFEGLFEEDKMIGNDWTNEIRSKANILPLDLLKKAKTKSNLERKEGIDDEQRKI